MASATSPAQDIRLIGYDERSGAMAVEVSLAERTYGPITMAGRFGFLSVDAQGQPLSAYLLDGTLLKCGDFEHTLEHAHSHLPVASAAGKTKTTLLWIHIRYRCRPSRRRERHR